MPRVIHFEIHAAEPERAVAFYRTVFRWTCTRWEGPVEYWLIKTGEDGERGINGGLIRRHGPIDGEAVIAYVCTIDVPSVDEWAGRITAAGGTIVLPKMAIPGVGWLAYVKDTQSNLVGLMKNDPAAA